MASRVSSLQVWTRPFRMRFRVASVQSAAAAMTRCGFPDFRTSLSRSILMPGLLSGRIEAEEGANLARALISLRLCRPIRSWLTTMRAGDHFVPKRRTVLSCPMLTGLDHADLELLPIRSAKDQPRIHGQDSGPLEAANSRFIAVIRPGLLIPLDEVDQIICDRLCVDGVHVLRLLVLVPWFQSTGPDPLDHPALVLLEDAPLGVVQPVALLPDSDVPASWGSKLEPEIL